MLALTISPHVRLCQDRDFIVFLDLRADRYWTLDAAHTRGFSQHIRQWPFPAVAGAASGVLLDSLLKRRILTAGEGAFPGCRSSARPPDVEAPCSDLTAVDHVATHRPRYLPAAVAGTATAEIVRHLTLQRIVQRVTRRKLSASVSRQSVARHTRSIEEYAQLVRAFEWARPLLYTSFNRCFFDSLALIEYLARFGLHPTWIFGVQAAPFAAHCWLQHGTVALNDSAEHARRYTPILAI